MNKEEWLERRKKFITSTEVAALLGLSEWESPFALWHRKRGGLSVEKEESEAMYFGKKLEKIVAEAVAEEMEVVVSLDNEFRTMGYIGASYDYTIDEEGHEIPLEIKTVDKWVFKEKFLVQGDVVLEMPYTYELQVQAQLLLHESDKSYVAILVGGNKLYITTRYSDKVIQKRIMEKAEEFWESTEPPPVDHARDLETLALIYGDVNEEAFHSNELIDGYAQKYNEAAKAEKEAAIKKRTAKAKILELMGTASKVLGDGYTISRKVVPSAKISYTRKEYMSFFVRFKKKREQDDEDL